MQPSPIQQNPRIEYERRLEDRSGKVQAFVRQSDRFSTFRGLVFIAGIAVLLAATVWGALSLKWIAAPILVFVLLIILHARCIRRLKRARQAEAYYRTALDRLNHQWIDVRPAGEEYYDPQHMYAGDLDLLGRGSLFQLICSARTKLGEETLARWLLTPATAEEIRARQQSVEELRNELDFRETLELLEAEQHGDIEQTHLSDWVKQPLIQIPAGLKWASMVTGVFAALAVISWLLSYSGIAPICIAIIIQVCLLFGIGSRIRELLNQTDEVRDGLSVLSDVLSLIEQREFQSPHLTTIITALQTDGVPPSRSIAQLRRNIQGLNNCFRNQFSAPITILLGIPFHYMFAIERWLQRVGPHCPEWLAAVGEFEALCSLAGYAYEHPEDPFPEIVDTTSGPRLEGVELGHPLIPLDQVVRNDVTLNTEHRLLMISGSNMSGKSTLMRTVGTNFVLALAGAPVRATRLTVTPMQAGTAMRVQDSLQQGASLFYQSVARLSAVVHLADAPEPVLFLLDEILQGTNSHDRRIGAQSVIETLIERGGIGIVTTHDLALTEITDQFGSLAKNVHFEDQLIDGKMTFDYRMRPGIVEHSNALELMKMMGIELKALDTEQDPESADLKQ
ncbi:MutS-related protein [Gimesia algae]|uniref:DNA mismatch repair protein MutS n=1 Tax=Gimesia algae TaxID=2527971 RepID=A0A517VDB4_9PLAN|nr:DNA mismatch repair protein MutS [Gimesia algae]QDT90977.1 DNA mismatch repair protein MutS [Gimesia algae]